MIRWRFHPRTRNPLVRLLALVIGAAALVVVIAFGLFAAAALVVGGAIVLLVKALTRPSPNVATPRARPQRAEEDAAEEAPAPAEAAAPQPAADAPLAVADVDNELRTTTPEQQRLVHGAPLYNPNVSVHIVQKKRFADEGNTLELRALTIGQHYWFAIESFDERGVSKLGEPVRIE